MKDFQLIYNLIVKLKFILGQGNNNIFLGGQSPKSMVWNFKITINWETNECKEFKMGKEKNHELNTKPDNARRWYRSSKVEHLALCWHGKWYLLVFPSCSHGTAVWQYMENCASLYNPLLAVVLLIIYNRLSCLVCTVKTILMMNSWRPREVKNTVT